MNVRKLFQIVLILMVAVLVTACGGGGSSSSSSSSSSSGSSTTVNLPQTVTSEADADGNVTTVGYPEGWVAASEFGSVTLANSQAVMDLMNADDGEVRPAAGQVGGNMSVIPTADLSFLGVEEGASVADVLSVFLNFFTGDEATTTNLSAPEAVTLNGKSSAIVTGTVTDEDGTLDATAVAVSLDNAYAVFLFVAAEGQIAQFNNAIRAIAGSVTYGPAG